MDSEDDAYEDATDFESVEDEEEYRSDKEVGYCSSDQEVGYCSSTDEGDSRPDNYYIRLEESDIKQRQEDDITSVSSVLSMSRCESSILLRHYKWSVSKVHEAWFADEDKVRETVGLLNSKPIVVDQHCANKSRNGSVTCRICFEAFSRNDGSMRSAACGHLFCSTCWEGYIRTSINDGPGCLMLRCPDPSCVAAIDDDMIGTLVSEADNQKYSRYLVRSYIENNTKTKWCPAPGCENAVEFVGDKDNYDVSCLCSHAFCWNCTEDAHRPVDCSTVKKWILKNSAESENTNWILANSKSCPECKRAIEKNHGCMHMTCTPPCQFQFCWLCLGAWSEHGARTGGFYGCNRYETAKREGRYDKAEKRREMAKSLLERYTHYFERWQANQQSRQKALAALKQMETVDVNKLSDIQRQPHGQLNVIVEAWRQIVECRRVLKWTYAYGYYLPENEQAKRKFFEHVQGDAESALEKLHHCAEKELQQFLDTDSGPSQEFLQFREKLAGVAEVNKKYFKNLVNAFENGLADVGSEAARIAGSDLDD